MVSIPFPSRDQPTSTDGAVAVALRNSWLHTTRLGRLTWSLLFYGGQVLLLGVLYMAYRLGRRLAVGRELEALANAQDVWSLERLLVLPDESSVQRLALHSTHLLELANRFYMGVHFPASMAFLVWVLLRHRDTWPRVRMVILSSTGVALLIHMLYPLAPPRFLPQVMPHVSLVDTGAVFGPTPYTAGDTVANQYAAMPSLHVGWSILVAWGVIVILRSRARWLILLHPILTVVVVVITANHYWMDGLIGGGLVGSAVWLTRPTPWSRVRAAVARAFSLLLPARVLPARLLPAGLRAGRRGVSPARSAAMPVHLPEQRPLAAGTATRATTAATAATTTRRPVVPDVRQPAAVDAGPGQAVGVEGGLPVASAAGAEPAGSDPEKRPDADVTAGPAD